MGALFPTSTQECRDLASKLATNSTVTLSKSEILNFSSPALPSPRTVDPSTSRASSPRVLVVVDVVASVTEVASAVATEVEEDSEAVVEATVAEEEVDAAEA